MKCPMLEKGHGEWEDHDRAEKKNPFLRTLPDEDGKSSKQTGDGDGDGECLQPRHIWAAQCPGQSCAIAFRETNRSAPAYLQIPNIDKIKREKVDERSCIAGGRPTDDSGNGVS